MTRQESGSYLSVILELSKVKITVAVAFTTITGYILAARGYDPGFLLPTLGIFFLACGSSVINHLQERRTDAMMARTRKRPLPSHKISFSSALMVAVTETLAGSLILYFSSGIVALYIGIAGHGMVQPDLYQPETHYSPRCHTGISYWFNTSPGWMGGCRRPSFQHAGAHYGSILFCMAGTAFLSSGHKIRTRIYRSRTAIHHRTLVQQPDEKKYLSVDHTDLHYCIHRLIQQLFLFQSSALH